MTKEHPRHIILDEMYARGWEDSDLMQGMDERMALGALLYIHVEQAEIWPAADGVLAALEKRFGVSDGFLQQMDDHYRAAIAKAKGMK